MKRFVIILPMAVLLWACLCPDLRAAAPEQGELSAEGLLFLEVPVVVTASRKEQPVTEAPAAVTVITAEAIRQSGALTIPDVLRMVSGVDVITFSARDQQVGIRGFNGPLINKLLVLIDGRSVYNDFFGNVYWSLLPITMEEIERIEVVKSPISSLYGANAFSGVVNIIPKSPQALEGTEVNLSAGSHDTYIGSLIHAGAWKKLRYKLSAGFDRTDEWEGDRQAGDIARGNFYLGYDIDPRQSVAFSGGRTHFRDLKVFVFETFGAIREKGDYDYLQADYRLGGLKVRAFWKSEFQDQKIERSTQLNVWDVVTYGTEAQYAFDAWKWHSFVLGADYRNIILKKNNFIGEDRTQDLYALYLEDEVRLSEKLRLTAGLRFDHHPLVKEHYSPRGTLLYSPTENRTFRLSVAQAFRNPSLLESYLQSTTPGAVPVIGVGNPDLESEEITSYEAGYRTTLTKRAMLGVNVFYNEYDGLFINTREFAPPNIIVSFANGGDAWGGGGEIDLEFRSADWLSLFINYSYQRIVDEDDNPFTASVNEEDRARHDTPRHKVNAGARATFKNGLTANLLLHWVDGTKRLISDLAGNEFLAGVRSYTIVTGRVGYTFWKEKAEASLNVFNLFNDRHYEYPPGINLPDKSSDKVGRKVAVSLSFRF